MKPLLVSCTRQKDYESFSANTMLGKSLNQRKIDVVRWIEYNNKLGMPKIYNLAAFPEKGHKHDVGIFCHDDVYIDDGFVVEKVNNALKQYDIVGLAGGMNPIMQKPALWHLMCGGWNGGRMRGSVAHTNDKGLIEVTNFGPTPHKVDIIDGLFIAVNLKRAREVGWRFNENFNFHHYDISSSLDATKLGLRIGVFPIWVIHSSPGLRSFHEDYLKSEEKFLSLYK